MVVVQVLYSVFAHGSQSQRHLWCKGFIINFIITCLHPVTLIFKIRELTTSILVSLRIRKEAKVNSILN